MNSLDAKKNETILRMQQNGIKKSVLPSSE